MMGTWFLVLQHSNVLCMCIRVLSTMNIFTGFYHKTYNAKDVTFLIFGLSMWNFNTSSIMCFNVARSYKTRNSAFSVVSIATKQKIFLCYLFPSNFYISNSHNTDKNQHTTKIVMKCEYWYVSFHPKTRFHIGYFVTSWCACCIHITW